MIALHQSLFGNFAGVISSNTVSAQSQQWRLLTHVDCFQAPALGSATLWPSDSGGRIPDGAHSAQHIVMGLHTRRSRSRDHCSGEET
jgi:hypothetical protein